MSANSKKYILIYANLPKRLVDLTILVTAHIAFLPIWVILWTAIPLAIWLEDHGPVFFIQKRVGINGKSFSLFKFRSMRQRRIGEEWAEATEATDHRITKVGEILRLTALDELPQVLNIFKGDLSIVGPRPLPMALYEEFAEASPLLRKRVQIRPGLTGLAQVYLPRNCEPQTKLESDLLYASKMSLWLDLKLIFLSVIRTLAARWTK